MAVSLQGLQFSVNVQADGNLLERVVFSNHKTCDEISAKKFFTIKMSDGRVVTSADFVVVCQVKESEHIRVTMTNDEFKVQGDICLLCGKRYASITLSLSSCNDQKHIQSFTILPFVSKSPFVYGSIKSSPIISDSLFFTPQNPLMESRAYEGGVTLTMPIKLPLQKEAPVVCTAYVGAFTIGQLRRDFNEFINDARDRKYDPYLHYNSWLDIGFFNPYTEEDALIRIRQFGNELVAERKTPMQGFVFDDGWDDRKGNWAFSKDFPNDFCKLKTEAEKHDAQLGIWLSPWGGYGKPLQERVSHAAEFGYELSDAKFALSGPVYFRNFNERVLAFITDQNITHFKLDGTGNADTLIEGSQFTSDFDAAIRLISNAREANANVYINLTTGTTATPAWLFFADSIWRGGDDINFYGGGSKVQQWITYRDAETYRSVVRPGPLFPLNSLMLHGLVYAKQAEHLDKQSPEDFADQCWSYFATGTQLQELYVTPELLSKGDWDILAKAANWSRQNKDILFDTHWIGGDPTHFDVYGWASWSKGMSIITLRNPSTETQPFFINTKSQLEIPVGEPCVFNVQLVYGENRTVPDQISNTSVIELAPLELITLMLQPL